MTSSPENTVRIRQPRQSQAPNQRNQQIYLDYQTGQRQIDLAEQYHLTQTRISQIIRRVEKWLHAAWDQVGATAGLPSSAAGSDTADLTARQRLQHRLQYDRLSEAARLALLHFHQPQKVVTHKKGARAGKEFHETTERLLPPSLQCLKVVAQTTAQLTRLQASERRQPVGSASGEGLQNEPGDGAPDSALRNPQSALLPLSREQVEAWLVQQNAQAAQAEKVPDHIDAKPIIHDFVGTLLGESQYNWALRVLADDVGKKVVDRRPYEDEPPPVPNRDGWYYAMYDANGGLVAWLRAEQLKDAITPDYPPVSRSSTSVGNALCGVPSAPTRSVSEGQVLPTPPSATSDAPTPLLNPTSSTSPSPTDPPQPSSTPALTPVSPQTQFPAQYEPQPFDLQSIRPSFYQKGCHN